MARCSLDEGGIQGSRDWEGRQGETMTNKLVRHFWSSFTVKSEWFTESLILPILPGGGDQFEPCRVGRERVQRFLFRCVGSILPSSRLKTMKLY